MLKAGLIVGGVSLFLVLGVSSILSPLCAICVAIFAGLGAGYLAGMFERPYDSAASTKAGAGAGAVAGGLSIVGQLIASVINAISLQNSGFTEMLGLPATDTTTLWVAQIGMALCMGLLNIAIMAGLGAAGSAIWLNMNADEEDFPPEASVLDV